MWYIYTFGMGCSDVESVDLPSYTGDSVVMVEEKTITVEDVGADVEFMKAAECGECHPSQYDEWRQSMHAYAPLSPVFDAMAQKAFRDTSGEVGTFCTGCHTPIGTIQGEDGSTVAAQRSTISRDGVSCDVCHSAVSHDTPIGNLSLNFATDGAVYGPYQSAFDDGHDSKQKEIFNSPELCGSCHDVFNFPGLRIEEAYTEYTTSPAAEMGQTCQDCHMSFTPGTTSSRPSEPIAYVDGQTYPNRSRSSHRFVGPDYSLLDSFPYADDTEKSQLAQEELKGQIQILLENAVQIGDISIERQVENSPNTHKLSLYIESLVAGHNVPTGFTSERQLWVEVTVRSSSGDIVFQSGNLDENLDLYDAHSWVVQHNPTLEDKQLVNFQSRNILRHGEVELPTIEETVFPFDADFIDKRSIKPLEKRLVSYEFPAVANGTYSVSVRLRYRNLPPYLLRALQLDDLVPRLEIFTIDAVQIEL